jgi:transcriptional regulator GlxA family with amidase domain
VEGLRVEAARVLIEQSRYTMDEVATETGFGDTERMRRAFLRAFGQPPQSLRRNARAGRTECSWLDSWDDAPLRPTATTCTH